MNAKTEINLLIALMFILVVATGAAAGVIFS